MNLFRNKKAKQSKAKQSKAKLQYVITQIEKGTVGKEKIRYTERKRRNQRSKNDDREIVGSCRAKSITNPSNPIHHIVSGGKRISRTQRKKKKPRTMDMPVNGQHRIRTVMWEGNETRRDEGDNERLRNLSYRESMKAK